MSYQFNSKSIGSFNEESATYFWTEKNRFFRGETALRNVCLEKDKPVFVNYQKITKNRSFRRTYHENQSYLIFFQLFLWTSERSFTYFFNEIPTPCCAKRSLRPSASQNQMFRPSVRPLFVRSENNYFLRSGYRGVVRCLTTVGFWKPDFLEVEKKWSLCTYQR